MSHFPMITNVPGTIKLPPITSALLLRDQGIYEDNESYSQTQALTAFSAENLLNNNTSSLPQFDGIMQYTTNVTSNEAMLNSRNFLTLPQQPIDLSVVQSFVSGNNHAEHKLPNLAVASASGPSNICETVRLSSTNANDTHDSDNSESEYSIFSNEGADAEDAISEVSTTSYTSHDSRQCTVCKMRFKCISALKIHYRTHTGRSNILFPPNECD